MDVSDAPVSTYTRRSRAVPSYDVGAEGASDERSVFNGRVPAGASLSGSAPISANWSAGSTGVGWMPSSTS